MGATNSTQTFTKAERICKQRQMDRLFGGGGGHAMTNYPLRMVYVTAERGHGEPAAQILISVPKRHLKHATERNRVKRQVREAYRHWRHLLADAIEEKHVGGVDIAFVWLSDKMLASDVVGRKVRLLLLRVAEKI